MAEIAPEELSRQLQTDSEDVLVVDIRYAEEDELGDLEVGPNNCTAE